MNLATFAFKNAPVRIVDREGNPWFVAADVCRILALGNTSRAVSSLKARHKGITLSNTLGGTQKMLIISEPGLYRLVSKSETDEADAFMDWVTEEVLPSIRRTGAYDSGANSMTAALEKFVQANLKGKLAESILNKITPRGEYGELSRNGQPKTGFRRACYVAQRSRQSDAVRIMGLLYQLELFAGDLTLK